MRVISKSNFVTFASGVYNTIMIEVEEEARHVLVIHLPSFVSFILSNRIHLLCTVTFVLCINTNLAYNLSAIF